MGSPIIFKGSEANLINSGGIVRKDGTIIDSTNLVTNSEGRLNANDWDAYADAAGVEPVDADGGAPTITVTRNTTTPLKGNADLQFTKDAANRQGEGVRTVVTPKSFQANKVMSVRFDYSPGAAMVKDDVRVFIYDVDNAQLITIGPDDSLDPAEGTFFGTFNGTDSATYRLAIHQSSTSALAYNINFTNVEIDYAFNSVNYGPAMTDWSEPETLSITATVDPTKGTVAVDQIRWRQVGDSAEVFFQLELTAGGTNGTGNYLFDLPGSLNLDTAKYDISSATVESNVCGVATVNHSGGNTGIGHIQMLSATQFGIWHQENTTFPTRISATHGGLAATNLFYSGRFTIPISGWSTNVVNSESRTFKASYFAANGTRVTATPTALGEYRTLIKDNALKTFSDTDGSSEVSSADGFHIYFFGGNGAGTATEPNRWEIFVGKNKHVSFEYYNNTGRTGQIDTDFNRDPNNDETGVMDGYDPTTGLAFVYMPVITTLAASRYAGTSVPGATGAIVSEVECYFDIVVSDNALAVQQESKTSRVWVYDGLGRGSTNTAIRTFNTVHETVGTDITYTSSATLGDSFTINKSGTYSMAYMDAAGVGTSNFGFSLNSANLTTSIVPLASSNPEEVLTLCHANASGGDFNSCSISWYLNAGDVIRPHCTVGAQGAQTRSTFKIQRVG